MASRTAPRSRRLGCPKRPACIKELRVRRLIPGPAFHRYAVRRIVAFIARRGGRRDHHA